MLSSLGSALAYLTMRELEKIYSTIYRQQNAEIIRTQCGRHTKVDWTQACASNTGETYCFYKKFWFTTESINNGNVHFLDLALVKTLSDVYRKDTKLGQYILFDSYKPW